MILQITPHRILRRIALVTVAFSLLCATPELQAQNKHLNDLKKKGRELAEKKENKTLDKDKKNSGKKNSSATKNTSQSKKSNTVKEAFNKEDITSLQAIDVAWLEPIGFASTKGELSPAFKLPEITSSESVQMKYVQGRPSPQEMTNQALLDEYLALQDWMNRAKASKKRSQSRTNSAHTLF